ISGIGKSTLLKLLLGIYTPDEGKISIVYSDGSEEILSAKHRKLFSYVPQGNMILSGTIRKNVVFFNKTDDEQKVIKCLKLAGLWDDVCEMTNGINTKIGENGTGISEGQAQRVAIARALYYNAPIILFDEATSALDNETEKNVLYNIRKLNNKTCILVSHKPAAEEITDLKVEIESRKIKWKK
ncbi:MAG: ATP-binding cassette domain-containing protein, partial [Clostridia bacterium]|nr:ATP-binding cassette domain-containing protein [Clostridia bacterium]